MRKIIMAEHAVTVDILQLALDMQMSTEIPSPIPSAGPSLQPTLQPFLQPIPLATSLNDMEILEDELFAAGRFEQLLKVNDLLRGIWDNQFPKDCKTRKAWIVHNFQLTGTTYILINKRMTHTMIIYIPVYCDACLQVWGPYWAFSSQHCLGWLPAVMRFC